MSYFFKLLGPILFLGCCFATHAQPPAPPATAGPIAEQEAGQPPYQQTNMARMFERQIRRLVEVELNCLAQVTKVDDDKLSTLREATDTLIKEEANAIANEAGRNASINMSPFAMSDSLHEKFLAVAEESMDPDDLNRYREDWDLRQKLIRTSAQRSVLIMLDQTVCLSSKQEKAVAKVLMSSWDSKWNLFAAMMGNPLGGMALQQMPGFDVEKLKPTMRESQFMVLKGFADMNVAKYGVDQSKMIELEADQFARLAVEEIVKLCKLSPDQADKLDSSVQRAKDAAVQKKSDAFSQMTQATAGIPHMEAASVWSTPTSRLIKISDLWKNGITKTLDQKQQVLIGKREEIRNKRERTAMATMIANSFFGGELGLSGKQIQATTKVLVDNVGPGFLTGMQSQMEQISNIPEPLFQDILDDGQLIQLSTLMNQIRQQMAMMKQQQGAVE